MSKFHLQMKETETRRSCMQTTFPLEKLFDSSKEEKIAYCLWKCVFLIEYVNTARMRVLFFRYKNIFNLRKKARNQ